MTRWTLSPCRARHFQRRHYLRRRHFRRFRPASAAANDQTRTLETVTVTDQRLTIDLLPEKILDTPQSINVVPAEVIRQQGVNNLQDALKNVPGITLNAGEGGTHGDLVNLRGFSAGDDYFMDGLRDTGLYDRDTLRLQNRSRSTRARPRRCSAAARPAA